MKMSLTALYVPVKVLFQICERTRLPRKPVQNVFLMESLYSRKEWLDDIVRPGMRKKCPVKGVGLSPESESAVWAKNLPERALS